MIFDLKIKRRDDLIPPGVHLKYRVTSKYNNNLYVQVINDVATTIAGVTREGVGATGALCNIATFISAPSTYLDSGTQTTLQTNGRTFGAKMATLDFEGVNTLAVNVTSQAIGLSTGTLSGATLAMCQALWPEFQNVSSLATYTGSSFKVLDDTGADITSEIGSSAGQYGYFLLDPHIPTWLANTITSGNPLAKQATIIGSFAYTENAQTPAGALTKGSVAFHEKHARCTLCQLAAGTYAQAAAAEVVPYGLAGFIYNIEKAPQYEGSVSLQEAEVTDLCPLGNNLNIINSANAEWTTMAACIQNVTYDLLAGRTTLNFGPPPHLGAPYLAEQLRANRGPRWYYLI
jgi:hypothetical protein